MSAGGATGRGGQNTNGGTIGSGGSAGNSESCLGTPLIEQVKSFNLGHMGGMPFPCPTSPDAGADAMPGYRSGTLSATYTVNLDAGTLSYSQSDGCGPESAGTITLSPERLVMIRSALAALKPAVPTPGYCVADYGQGQITIPGCGADPGTYMSEYSGDFCVHSSVGVAAKGFDHLESLLDTFRQSTGGLGMPCDVGSEAGPTMNEFNDQALQCPSLVCIKSAVDPGAGSVGTGPLCTISCKSDADCVGQLGDPANSDDRRCRKGFACEVIFVKGRLACQRFCTCKDFLAGPPKVQPPGCP